MVCFEEFVAVAPAEELPPMPAAGIVLEVDGCDFLKSSDASTRSGSPSASSATSEQCSTEDFKARNSCGGLTWEDLENELLSKLPIRKECTQNKQVLPAPSSPPRSQAPASAILGSCPKQRARPSTIALPSDASERTPMATPATGSWPSCGGIMGTPASCRPPLPRSDASQRAYLGTSPQSDLSFMASAWATSPNKRRHALLTATGDASQRSPTKVSPADLGPRKSMLSTMGTNKTPATGDASRRSTPSSPAAEVKAWTATPTSSQPAASPASSQRTSANSFSTTPTPGSPVSVIAAAAAAEANAAATAAAAQAAAEAAAAAAATAAATAKTAAEAAAMAAAAARASTRGGDASQRTPTPMTPTPESSACATDLPSQMRPCDSMARHLCAKELEAHLRAAAPEVYED
eukprot:TRINITY_DN4650_c0_g1_i7.p1 TRINITY_DN4650_c0_g1~~TRINITY_DN4650_c0_g1_i7.p1  ORF type:complete len:407 (+),score=105.34 TRINITY_DN4650_c0_g1_i7:71-1291(+)